MPLRAAEVLGVEIRGVVGGEQESENKDDSIRTGKPEAAQANLSISICS